MSITDSDADEEISILAAARADLSPPRKKRRLNNSKSQAQDYDDSSTEDNLSDSDGDEKSCSDKENNQSQYQINVKNNKKRRRPLKQSRHKPNTNKTNTNNDIIIFNDAVPPGAVCRLELINFLCHSNFAIAFHPNVNIISGQNGSGKSAVEAGISMALGQSSKKTGRGNKLTDVIKFDKDFAVIKLYLHNTGPERITEFGREIVIERKLSRTGKNGASYFKILDGDTLKTKATGLKAVRAIADKFNLCVDNPSIILKQSVAKHFLNSTKPADKFDFFMQASKLQAYEDFLQAARDNVREAQRQQKQTKGSFIAIRTQYFEAKSRVDTLEKMESQKEKVLFWERAELFMIYHKESKTLFVFVERIALIVQKIESSQQTLERLQIEFNHGEIKAKRVSDEMKEKMAEADQYQQPMNILKKEQKDLDKQRSTATRKVSSLQRYIDSGRRKIKDFTSQYDECVNSIQNNERGQKLAAIQEKLNDFSEKLNSYRNEREILKDKTEKSIEMKDQEQRLRDKQNEYYHKENEIDGVRNQLKQLQQESNRSEFFIHPSLRNRNRNRNRYNNNRNEISIANIRGCIERNKRKFQRLPIGPLGEFIQMKSNDNNDQDRNHKDIQIVQKVLNSSLFVFLVDSSRDMQIFRDIMYQQFHKTVPCIQYAYSNRMEEIGVNPFNNRGDIIRVSDMFIVRDNNAWVYNAILTNSGPERVYAHGDLTEARRFLSSLDNSRLRCVNYVVTLKEQRGLYMVRRSGTSVSGTPCNKSNPILQADRSAAIQWYSNELNAKMQEKSNMERCMHELKRFVAQNEQIMKDKQRQFNGLNRNIRMLDNKIDKLQREQRDLNEEEEDNNEAQEQMQELQNSIEDEKSQIESLQEEITPFKERENELLLTISQNKSKLQALEAKIKTKKGSLNSDKRLFNDLMDELKKKRLFIQKIPSKIAQFERELKQDRDDYEEEKERINNLLLTAQACGTGEEVLPAQYPRNPANRNRVFSITNLKRQRLRLDAEISEWENAPGNSNSEEIRRRFANLKPKYESHQQRVDNCNKNVDEVNRLLHHRRKELEAMKVEVSRKLSNEFRLIMMQQGHDGTLNVNYETGELEMCIHMKSHDGETQVRNSKTLSGGERSFTQVALIMALQKFSGSPMCIYDEFDVFMDSVNRGNSIKILLKAALGGDKHGRCERQYIFITPNDVSPIIAEKRHKNQIRIHKLQAPRRSQQN